MFHRNNLTEEERKELRQLADKIFAHVRPALTVESFYTGDIDTTSTDWKRYSALVTKLSGKQAWEVTPIAR